MKNEEKLEHQDVTKFKAFPTEDACIFGMSLLDYFAGQAMQLMNVGTPEQRAKKAYEVAEGMVKHKIYILGDEDE